MYATCIGILLLYTCKRNRLMDKLKMYNMQTCFKDDLSPISYKGDMWDNVPYTCNKGDSRDMSIQGTCSIITGMFTPYLLLSCYDIYSFIIRGIIWGVCLSLIIPLFPLFCLFAIMFRCCKVYLKIGGNMFAME